MLILTLRTDRPEAELGLFDGQTQLSYLKWQAHRQLAETIHLKIRELTDSKDTRLKDLDGVVIFKGPGSFTGLRIGFSVANVLADSLKIPIVSELGNDWQNGGIAKLAKGQNETIALPFYGADPKTTQQKK